MGVYGIHIDMANRAAAIPGSGEDVASFTYSFDIARFVEAALGLEKWETEMYCYSDNVTHNEILRIAEDTVGMASSMSTLFHHCLNVPLSLGDADHGD
jgi:hypothetical protein